MEAGQHGAHIWLQDFAGENTRWRFVLVSACVHMLARGSVVPARRAGKGRISGCKTSQARTLAGASCWYARAPTPSRLVETMASVFCLLPFSFCLVERRRRRKRPR
jgi:hypothetical protein